MSKPNADKLAKALETRDRAVAFAKAHGAWKGAGKNRIFSADIGDLSVSYRTPFNKLPPPDETILYMAALLGGNPDLPYGIDIWHRHKKVMNIEWSDTGEVHLAAFHRGGWENALAANDE